MISVFNMNNIFNLKSDSFESTIVAIGGNKTILSQLRGFAISDDISHKKYNNQLAVCK